MGETKKQIIEKAAFVFESYKAETRVDFLNESPNKDATSILKIFADEHKPIKFAYQYGDGLISIANVDSKRKINVLGEFLKIKFDNFEGYKKFFNDYGFLFKISSDSFSKVEFSQISKIAERLKCTVNLINEVNNFETTDYRKIMELSLFLFLDSGWSIKIANNDISSTKYELAELINNSAMDCVSEIVNRQEEVNFGYFKIDDIIFGEYNLSSKEYHDIVDSDINDEYDDFRYKAITYLFANYKTDSFDEREYIDLIFHYFHDAGIPIEIKSSGCEYIKKFNPNHIEDLADSIINFAKYIIKSEIDSNIYDIHPVYNEKEMRPDWKINSLLGALYLSLFYLDSKNEMLRRCEYCGCYFIVKRTSSTKKYCSSYCRNNAQQAKHRLKIKTQNK